jgi:predicted glycosyltransferase
VRDILVEKEDRRRHETRAVEVLNRWFDALLVHADPALVRLEATFSRMHAIRIPVVYTGYVAPAPAPPTDRAAWRQARGVASGEALVVVSAGGGAVGYPLLSAAVQAVAHLPADFPVRVRVFTGPFLSAAESRALRQIDDPRVGIDPFAEDFQTWLHAADLSLSMAGYNTCMAILSAGVRALVLPFAQNREQAMRARLLEERGLLTVLTEEDLAPSALAACMQRQLRSASPQAAASVDITGAAYAARWIEGHLAQREPAA